MTRIISAAERLIALQEAETSFLGFVRALHPDYVLAPFQLTLINTLDQLEKRTLTVNDRPIHRLLITMPPRHGKSYFATTLFPVYYMGRDPRRTVMSTSYNADLAKTFGRAVKDTAQLPLVSQAFPAFSLHEEATAINFWKTTALGAYFGVGLGGTTTGRAANLLITDDPVKARAEAESASYRNNTWSYYTSALLTRKQPEPSGLPPIELFIQTRWHPDDPAGRIMESPDWDDGDWLHLNFQAISGTEENPIALWPDRFPVEALKKIERRDPREFAALYQQSPFIAGGNILKTSNFRTYTPETLPDKFASLIICADTAFKKTETADYSVLLVAAVDHSGLIYLLDLIRQRLDFTELKSRVATLNAIYRPRGLSAIYIEDKASGQSLIQDLRQSHLPVLPYKVHNDKVARANAASPLLDSGIIAIPQSATWLDPFIAELQSFPATKHDDQVDAFTMAIAILSRTAINSNETLSSPLPKFLQSHNIAHSTSFPPLIPKERTDYKHLLSWGE